MVVYPLVMLMGLLGFGHDTSAVRNDEAAGIPSNLEAAGTFRSQLDTMWQRSPTFRRQCRRLAAAGVTVRLLPDTRPPAASYRARTTMRRSNGRLMQADVELPLAQSFVELVGHELEHIVEQLDGVELEAFVGTGQVWKTGPSTFETRRSIEAGRRVAAETDPKTVTTTQSQGLAAGRDGDARLASLGAGSLAPWRPARLSACGRYVAFASSQPLVERDRNKLQDVYVIDLATRSLTLESVAPDGAHADGDSGSPDISRDGRLVVFTSTARNLTGSAGVTRMPGVFVRDRATGVTRPLTLTAAGLPADGPSANPVISADGRTIVFESAATDLVGPPAGRSFGVYMVRLLDGVSGSIVVSRVASVPTGHSGWPAVSGDGRFIVFTSKADLVGPDSRAAADGRDGNGVADIYEFDTQTRATRRLSRSHDGRDPNGPSYQPAISEDGRHVAFVSEATNLTRGIRVRSAQIYVRDRLTGITELVSRTPTGQPGNGASHYPAISHDGTSIAFESLASDLVGSPSYREPLDTNLLRDVFVRDRVTQRTRRASADNADDGPAHSQTPTLDGTGHVLVFTSEHRMHGGGQVLLRAHLPIHFSPPSVLFDPPHTALGHRPGLP